MKTIQPGQVVGLCMALCVVLLVIAMLIGRSVSDNPHAWYDMVNATPTVEGTR